MGPFLLTAAAIARTVVDRYKGTFSAFLDILKTERLSGMWRGAYPTCVRTHLLPRLLYFFFFIFVCSVCVCARACVCVCACVRVREVRSGDLHRRTHTRWCA